MPMHTMESDTDPILACMAGHDETGEAFGALYLLHQRSLLSFVMKRFHFQETEAEDVVQETFLLAQRKMKTLESPDAFKTWLHSIAIHQALNRFRGRYSEQVALSEFHTSTLLSQEPAPEDLAIRNEIAEAVRAALENVPSGFREAVEDIDLADMKYDEVAQYRNIPSGTVKTRRMRGIHQLRKSKRLEALLDQSC